MTVPLEREFAQLWKMLEKHRRNEELLDGRDFDDDAHMANHAALSVIERHVQEMEKARLREIALALAYGAAAGSRAGEAIPQETWDSLFAEGLLYTTSHGVPGADMETDITAEGRDALLAALPAQEGAEA